MPRKADQELGDRIIRVAYKLWRQKGEGALTMRGVASAAGTTTPTVYQRFRDKAGLLALLRKRFLEDLASALSPGRTTLETIQLFLSFAVRHPHEYELLTSDWAVRLANKQPKPIFELIKTRLAKDLGGRPQQHRRLALALGITTHGAATMLLTEGVSSSISAELQDICLGSCKALIEIRTRRHRHAGETV